MDKKIKNAIKKVIPENVIRLLRAKINQHKINRMGEDIKVDFSKKSYPIGVNLIGMFSQDSGLGQSVRLVAHEIEKTNIPHGFIDFYAYPEMPKNNHEFDGKYTDSFKYGINVFHVNMQDLFKVYEMVKPDDWHGHYNIAFWLWEMEEFPAQWIPMINQLDEIWTPAEYVSRAIRKVTTKPVYTIPYIVEASYQEKYNRTYFSLPEDKFLFLMLFDSNSITERKNPMAAINAYKKAFSKDNQSVGLVIKIGNARDYEIAEIKEALVGYNVYFVNGMLPKIEVNSLLHCVDVYVSLHRSEGFGLVLAEAMLLKTPTIATNYSANTEFQNSSTSCLVNYRLIPVGQDIYPYQKEFCWADPNVDQAADYMKKLFFHKEFYEDIQKNAYLFMTDCQRKETSLNAVKGRIKEIYENS